MTEANCTNFILDGGLADGAFGCVVRVASLDAPYGAALVIGIDAAH